MQYIQTGQSSSFPPNKSKVRVYITTFFFFPDKNILAFGSHKNERGGERQKRACQDVQPDPCTITHYTPAL